MTVRKRIFLYCLSVILLSCSAEKQIKPVEEVPEPDNSVIINEPVKEEKTYNFKFTGYDINIDDPEWDRRTYYKIFIDKVEIGRTTIGLESQMKTFEDKISYNRHLLLVEKWSLDEKKGKYIKLNNIEQPKPHYVYFDLLDGQVVNIILKNDPINNKSLYDVVYE